MHARARVGVITILAAFVRSQYGSGKRFPLRRLFCPDEQVPQVVGAALVLDDFTALLRLQNTAGTTVRNIKINSSIITTIVPARKGIEKGFYRSGPLHYRAFSTVVGCAYVLLVYFCC